MVVCSVFKFINSSNGASDEQLNYITLNANNDRCTHLSVFGRHWFDCMQHMLELLLDMHRSLFSVSILTIHICIIYMLRTPFEFGSVCQHDNKTHCRCLLSNRNPFISSAKCVQNHASGNSFFGWLFVHSVSYASDKKKVLRPNLVYGHTYAWKLYAFRCSPYFSLILFGLLFEYCLWNIWNYRFSALIMHSAHIAHLKIENQFIRPKYQYQFHWSIF